MLRSNKANILEFKPKKNSPLLPSNSKGEKNKIRTERIKQRVRLKKFNDTNGM